MSGPPRTGFGILEYRIGSTRLLSLPCEHHLHNLHHFLIQSGPIFPPRARKLPVGPKGQEILLTLFLIKPISLIFKKTYSEMKNCQVYTQTASYDGV